MSGEDLDTHVLSMGLEEGKDFRLIGIDLNLKHRGSLLIDAKDADKQDEQLSCIQQELQQKQELLERIDPNPSYFSSVISELKQRQAELMPYFKSTMTADVKKKIFADLLQMNQTIIVHLLKFLLRKDNLSSISHLEKEWETRQTSCSISALFSLEPPPSWETHQLYHLAGLSFKSKRSIEEPDEQQGTAKKARKPPIS